MFNAAGDFAVVLTNECVLSCESCANSKRIFSSALKNKKILKNKYTIFPPNLERFPHRTEILKQKEKSLK